MDACRSHILKEHGKGCLIFFTNKTKAFSLYFRLANCIDPHQLNCYWGCPLLFEKKQTRLRHFIWSHQDLERLVMENFKVRLSGFMPSLLDLEIRKIDPRILEVSSNHHWIELAGVGGVNQKVVMDLAALSVHEHIDVLEDEGMLKILTNPQCELCGLEFKTGSTNAKSRPHRGLLYGRPILARDKKRQHLICHFRDVILKDLPVTRPFRCPKCPRTGKSLIDLTTHYGWNHNIVLAGKKDSEIDFMKKIKSEICACHKIIILFFTFIHSNERRIGCRRTCSGLCFPKSIQENT